MSPRIVIAALSVAVIGAVSPSLAQSPETSAAALAAPQPKSETASGPVDASKAANPASARTFTVERAATDQSNGKATLTPRSAKQ